MLLFMNIPIIRICTIDTNTNYQNFYITLHIRKALFQNIQIIVYLDERQSTELSADQS